MSDDSTRGLAPNSIFRKSPEERREWAMAQTVSREELIARMVADAQNRGAQSAPTVDAKPKRLPRPKLSKLAAAAIVTPRKRSKLASLSFAEHDEFDDDDDRDLDDDDCDDDEGEDEDTDDEMSHPDGIERAIARMGGLPDKQSTSAKIGWAMNGAAKVSRKACSKAKTAALARAFPGLPGVR